MTRAHRCLTRALPTYRAQLTPTSRCALPIQCKLGPLTRGLHKGSPIFSRRQPFTTSQPAMDSPSSSQPHAGPIKVVFSLNQPEDLAVRVEALLGEWQVTPSGKGLKKDFVFKTFNNAWKFMDTVAQECKVRNHHPEWSNLYNRVSVEWTTHRPEGLSVKDVDMAEFCDRTAAGIGLKSNSPKG